MNTPKIRFKGFKDDWEQRKLGDVTQEFKSGTSLKAEEIDIVGDYPVYGGNGLRGYTSRYNHDDEYALIGRQGALCGNMNYSVGKAYFTEHAVVVKADDNNDTMFLYYLLDTMNLGQYSDQSAQPGLAVNKLVKLENLFPTKVEQQRIGWYFSDLDNLITLHQRKCDETKQLKKFMLQKMFPKNGEKNPEIRFEGFTDDWEQRKLEDVMDTVTDYVAAGSFEDIRNNVTYLNEPGYAQLVRTVDLKKKFTNNDSVYVDESAFKYLWRVNLNDECIVLPNIGANIGEVYFVEPSGLPYDNNVLGPNAILLKANEDTYFAFTALNNLTFQKQLFENVGSSGQPKFNKTELKSIQLYMPQNEEQVKIGQYFRKLDHLITLHQRKCEKLKELKKFMLQNMFV